MSSKRDLKFKNLTGQEVFIERRSSSGTVIGYIAFEPEPVERIAPVGDWLGGIVEFPLDCGVWMKKNKIPLLSGEPLPPSEEGVALIVPEYVAKHLCNRNRTDLVYTSGIVGWSDVPFRQIIASDNFEVPLGFRQIAACEVEVKDGKNCPGCTTKIFGDSDLD